MNDMGDGFFISTVGKGHTDVLVGDVFMPSERKKRVLVLVSFVRANRPVTDPEQTDLGTTRDMIGNVARSLAE